MILHHVSHGAFFVMQPVMFQAPRISTCRSAKSTIVSRRKATRTESMPDTPLLRKSSFNRAGMHGMVLLGEGTSSEELKVTDQRMTARSEFGAWMFTL